MLIHQKGQQSLIKVVAKFIGITFFVTGLNTAQAASGPKIQLFPTAVKENIKQAVRATNSFNGGFERFQQELIAKGKMYKELGCDGSIGDKGCGEIRKQMKEARSRYAQELKESMPEIKRAISSAHKSLGKSIRKAQSKMTPKQLMEMLKESDSQVAVNRAKRKVRGSKNYGRIVNNLQLISRSLGSGKNGKPSNRMVEAAVAYAGLTDILNSVSQLEAEIEVLEIDDLFNEFTGQINESDVVKVESINEMIDGDTDDYYDTVEDDSSYQTQQLDSQVEW
jgi:hypothetical protein